MGHLTSVAGHWKEHLPFDLLWATGKGTSQTDPNNCTRSAAYRAPSWSWASIDGPIHFIWIFQGISSSDGPNGRFHFTIDTDAEVLDVAVDPAHEGRYSNGQLSGGSISLSGRLRKSTWGRWERHISRTSGPGFEARGTAIGCRTTIEMN